MPVDQPYAITRVYDPVTGDVRMSGPTWARSPSPMLEVILYVIKTPKGSKPTDPSFGVDYNLLQRNLPNLGVTWVAEVKRALKFYTDNRYITELSVLVDTSSHGLKFEVSFKDPQMPDRASTGWLRA